MREIQQKLVKIYNLCKQLHVHASTYTDKTGGKYIYSQLRSVHFNIRSLSFCFEKKSVFVCLN